MDTIFGASACAEYTTARVSIDIAHRVDSKKLSPLENARLYGKCNRDGGHGHRWTISVTAESVPYNTLMSIMKMAIEDNFDHRNLSLSTSCPHMAGVVPTVENFLYVASALLKRSCIDHNIDPYLLRRIRLFETRTSSISWDLTSEDIDHLQVGCYEAIDKNLPYTPTMAVTKRFEAWCDTDSIVPDIRHMGLLRCEGPGGGFPRHACHFDITMRGRLDTRRSAVELLSDVKEVLHAAVRDWRKPPGGAVDFGDLKQLFELCQGNMRLKGIDPSKLVEIHWERENTELMAELTCQLENPSATGYSKCSQLTLRECTYRPDQNNLDTDA